MRLRYSIRFDADAVVVAVPNVFPAYQATDWRGLVTMKPLGGTINPLPTLFGATSLTDVIVYRGGAQYKAGTTYTFSIDLIPDYVFQGAVSGRFCLHDQKFASNPARWNALITSTAPVRYSMAISDLDYAADIPLFYPQSLLRANFLAVGAFDCGPVPNIRF